VSDTEWTNAAATIAVMRYLAASIGFLGTLILVLPVH
jgi:hypothetical protein